jgi:hypothetical protein
MELRAIAMIAAVGLIAGAGRAAAGEPPGVTLRLAKVEAEPLDKEILFQCHLGLDNETGRELKVRSNFSSAFDATEIVVTDRDGKVIAQQDQRLHLSPVTAAGRDFPLKKGTTKHDLVFPIQDLPAGAKAFKVRLVGTLPGSGYDRILSTETLEVEVKK